MNVSWIWERTGRFAQESRLREKNQRFFGPKEVNTNGKAVRQSEPLTPERLSEQLQDKIRKQAYELYELGGSEKLQISLIGSKPSRS